MLGALDFDGCGGGEGGEGAEREDAWEVHGRSLFSIYTLLTIDSGTGAGVGAFEMGVKVLLTFMYGWWVMCVRGN